MHGGGALHRVRPKPDHELEIQARLAESDQPDLRPISRIVARKGHRGGRGGRGEDDVAHRGLAGPIAHAEFDADAP
jgi:hypothetical protein